MIETSSIALLFIFIYMCVAYVVCIYYKNNGIIDVFWGIGFIGICAILYYNSKCINPLQLITVLLIVLWATRLSVYLGVRNIGKPEDFRYATWRREWGNTFYIRTFLQVHMLQGIVMFIIALPLYVIFSMPSIHIKYELLIPGALLSGIGILVESVADYQKYQFKKNQTDTNAFIHDGLWKYSRHPNYLGELIFWWGLFLLSIPCGLWFVSIISPLLLSYLLYKVSGVPMLEAKYKNNKQYETYVKSTGSIFPKLPYIN